MRRGRTPEGWPVDAKRVYRPYKDMGLQLLNETPERNVEAKLRDDQRPVRTRSGRWTSSTTGLLAIVDTFTRHAPAVEPRFGLEGADVVTTLERVCEEVGSPRAIRVDRGPEFVSRDLGP
jgi:putative transposase